MRQARLAYRGLAGLFVAGAVLQFFLAGLGVFGTGAAFEVHATVGAILAFASIVLLALAGVLTLSGSLARRSAELAALLVVLMVVQYSLVELFSEAVPALAALHPVNSLLVLGVAMSLALERRLALSAGRSRRRS
jgi:Family of unknown function (DUF6220)